MSRRGTRVALVVVAAAASLATSQARPDWRFTVPQARCFAERNVCFDVPTTAAWMAFTLPEGTAAPSAAETAGWTATLVEYSATRPLSTRPVATRTRRQGSGSALRIEVLVEEPLAPGRVYELAWGARHRDQPRPWTLVTGPALAPVGHEARRAGGRTHVTVRWSAPLDPHGGPGGHPEHPERDPRVTARVACERRQRGWSCAADAPPSEPDVAIDGATTRVDVPGTFGPECVLLIEGAVSEAGVPQAPGRVAVPLSP